MRVTDEVVADPLKRTTGIDGAAEEDDAEDDAEEAPEPVKAMQPLASFDSMVIWDHDTVPTEDDGAVRALDEWIGMAEAMHDFDGAEQWWKTKTEE